MSEITVQALISNEGFNFKLNPSKKGTATVRTPSKTSTERNFAFTELNFQLTHQPQGVSHV